MTNLTLSEAREKMEQIYDTLARIDSRFRLVNCVYCLTTRIGFYAGIITSVVAYFNDIWSWFAYVFVIPMLSFFITDKLT